MRKMERGGGRGRSSHKVSRELISKRLESQYDRFSKRISCSRQTWNRLLILLLVDRQIWLYRRDVSDDHISLSAIANYRSRKSLEDHEAAY